METNKTETKWITILDINTEDVSDPEDMIGRFLAEDLIEHSTEEYTDTDTGEVVKIERNYLHFRSGVQITRDKLQEIQFFMQTCDVKSIKVCDQNLSFKRFIGGRLYPFEVTIWNELQKKTLLVRATSVEAAIQCMNNYAPLYLKFADDYSVTSVSAVKYVVYENEIQEDPSSSFTEYEHYKVTVRFYYYNQEKEKIEKEDSTLILSARDVDEAKTVGREWIDNRYKEEMRADPRNTGIILKASPYSTCGIIPLEYCKLFKEEQSI